MIFRSLILVSWIFLAVVVLCSCYEVINVPDNEYYNEDFSAAKKEKAHEKLNITVFYESLCPDCVAFFRNEFSNNWRQFYDYINVTLVPYGKATQTQDKKGNWHFDCQHGEEECHCNRIQACAISRMKEQRCKKLFSFISCYMSHKDKEKYGPKCAHPNNIAFGRLKKCAESKDGYDLLATYGNITHDFVPKINWIPTIVINGKYNQTENDEAASNLKSLLCRKLNNEPKVCTNK